MYETLEEFSLLKVEGIDAKDFVNRFSTNDLSAYKYSYNFFLNSKSRFLSDAFIYVLNNNLIFIETHQTQKERLIKHLNFYKLQEKITITDISDLYSIIYSEEQIDKNISLYTNLDPRYEKLYFRSVLNKKNLSSLEKNYTNTKDIYVKQKYKYSIIDGYSDLTYEKSIPLEFGAEELNSINFNKGCYLGQELISRTKTQGVIRKKIYKIVSEQKISDLIVPHTLYLKNNTKKIGVLCSYYKNIGIALINSLLVGDSDLIEIENLKFKIFIPPWYKTFNIK